MNTTTRRQFISILGGLVAAPVICAAAKQTPPAPDPTAKYKDIGLPGPTGVLVQGIAVKVPSNRMAYHERFTVGGDNGMVNEYRYVSDWDGTFKEERGCSNPAWVLADLYDRTGEPPDWVVSQKRYSYLPIGSPMVMDGVDQMLKPELNWGMLYHFGQWCDELVHGVANSDYRRRVDAGMGFPASEAKDYMSWFPRFTVNTVCQTRDEMVALRESLRMHCLRWQSTDPRYRTSYPGIPYTT